MREWLSARLPAPPPALVERLVTIVGDESCDDEVALPRVLVAHAVNLLGSLGDERPAAIDLLAADALMTYAMEFAAEDCQSVEEIANNAMQSVAVLASRNGHARERE